MSDSVPLPQMADYNQHLRRYWRRMLVCAAIGAVLGGSLFFLIDTRYFATSRVVLSPQITYLSISSEQERQPLVTLDTTAGLLRSDEAMGAIAAAMGVDRETATDSVEISARPLTRVIVVQVRADSAGQARRGVVTAVDKMLELQSEKFALADGRVRLLKRRVANVQAQAQESIATGAPSQSLFDTVRILQTRLDRAVATNNTSSEIIVRAQVMEYRPGQLEVFITSGFTLGLALALVSAGAIAPTDGPRRRLRMAS